MKYLYSKIKYVPDTIRCEHINIGLIATNGRQTKFRLVEKFDRAKQLGRKHIDQSLIYNILNSYINNQPDLDRLSYDTYGCVIQISIPLPVIADSVDGAISSLWERFILE